jgi:hypothetical protein
MYDHGGERMSILLHTSWMTKKFSKKEGIKMILERICPVALITILVTVTVLGFTAINPEVINGMLG